MIALKKIVTLKNALLVGAACWAGVATYTWSHYENRERECWETITHQREVLKMASQALTSEQRLRVVDQARLAGDSTQIDQLKWAFCFEYPHYRDYEAEAMTASLHIR